MDALKIVSNIRFRVKPARLAGVAVAGVLLLGLLRLVQGEEIVMVAPTPTQDPTLLQVDIPPTSDEEVPLPVQENNESVTRETREIADPGASGLSTTPRRFRYAFQFQVRGIYDDNINLSPTDPITDYYFTLEPKIVLAFGDAGSKKENYLRFDYAPRVFLFVDHTEDNAFQHVIRLEGQVRFSRLTLKLSQEVQLLDGTDVDIRTGAGETASRLNLDVSGRTELRLYTTDLSASYDLGGKTFLSGGVSYVAYDYPTLISSEVLAGNVYFNYNYSPKLTVGIGGNVGWSRVEDPDPDETFEQVNVRASYGAGGKLVLEGSAGVEFRQSDESGSSQRASPVFQLGATYKPFDGTSIFVTGARSTANSAVLAGQDYTLTHLSVGARQRVLRRFSIALEGGYQHAEYFNTIDGVSATREDNYYFIQPTVDVTLTRFWSVGAFFLHRQNSSADANFDFKDNQVGVQTTLTF